MQCSNKCVLQPLWLQVLQGNWETWERNHHHHRAHRCGETGHPKIRKTKGHPAPAHPIRCNSWDLGLCEPRDSCLLLLQRQPLPYESLVSCCMDSASKQTEKNTAPTQIETPPSHIHTHFYSNRSLTSEMSSHHWNGNVLKWKPVGTPPHHKPFEHIWTHACWAFSYKAFEAIYVQWNTIFVATV